MDYTEVHELGVDETIISEMKVEALELLAESMGIHKNVDVSWNELEQLPVNLYPDLCAAVGNFKIVTTDAFS